MFVQCLQVTNNTPDSKFIIFQPNMNWLTSAKRRVIRNKRKNDNERSTAWSKVQRFTEQVIGKSPQRNISKNISSDSK